MSLQGDVDKNSRVTFDGEPKNWPDFKWKVQHKFRRLGIKTALTGTKVQAGAEFKTDLSGTKATAAFELAYIKGDEFLYDALHGRAIRLVKDVPGGEIHNLWKTLTSYFEGSGTRTIDTLLQQVESVDVGRTQDSIADAIARFNDLYQELADQKETTSDARKISLLRRRLKGVDTSFELYFQAFMLQQQETDRTWDKFCVGVRANAATLSLDSSIPTTTGKNKYYSQEMTNTRDVSINQER